jgi:hypothetical protein
VAGIIQKFRQGLIVLGDAILFAPDSSLLELSIGSSAALQRHANWLSTSTRYSAALKPLIFIVVTFAAVTQFSGQLPDSFWASVRCRGPLFAARATVMSIYLFCFFVCVYSFELNPSLKGCKPIRQSVETSLPGLIDGWPRRRRPRVLHGVYIG